MSNLGNLETILKDSYGRIANYARFSITDRCNLKCIYCRGEKREKFIPHEKILRYEQIIRLMEICQKMGVSKVRITGGEPFARKDCINFLAAARKNFPDLRLAITTNGTLLDSYIEDLARLGLESVNISLDSFDRYEFARLSGADKLDIVLDNIDRLLAKKIRIKLNAVAIRGVTDKKFADYLYFAKTMPVDLRFIEFMPMGNDTIWDESLFLSCSELLKQARQSCSLLHLLNPPKTAGPAQIYQVVGGKGRLGFISAISNHFCNSCNRMRITSDGKLRACLFADREYRLAPLLADSRIDDEKIALVIARAFAGKPLGVNLLAARKENAVARKKMIAIGG